MEAICFKEANEEYEQCEGLKALTPNKVRPKIFINTVYIQCVYYMQ